MENNWGVTFVPTFDRSATNPTFSTLCDKVRLSVPGFELVSGGVCQSGTHANMRAMDLAFGGNRTECLFAMGSYVGGFECVEDYSSNGLISTLQSRLCLVREPVDVSESCRQNTVPFPYHIPNKTLDMTHLACLENTCIALLEKKLLLAKLSGTPYKALLMEYMLTGNGAELTHVFKVKLGLLLKKYAIVVIADEVMTGGRVGPELVMTLSQPIEFKERVKYITLGKIFDCGLTLECCSVGLGRNPQRGTSTELELAQAYNILTKIRELQTKGMIETTQQKFLRAFDLTFDDDEHLWGKGLLLFSSKSRSTVKMGLRNRYLPQIGDSKRLRKGSVTESECTSTWVNKMMIGSATSWLKSCNMVLNKRYSPVLLIISEYMISQDDSTISDGIYVKDLLECISQKRQEEMVSSFRKRKIAELGSKRGRSKKSPKSLFSETLNEAVENSDGFMISALKKKRRVMCFSIPSFSI